MPCCKSQSRHGGRAHRNRTVPSADHTANNLKTINSSDAMPQLLSASTMLSDVAGLCRIFGFASQNSLMHNWYEATPNGKIPQIMVRDRCITRSAVDNALLD